MRFAEAVQDIADEAAGEHSVDRFRDGAQRSGQAQPLGDGRGQFVRRCGDQPDLLPGIEMHLHQGTGTGPDLVGEDLVVDFRAECGQLLSRSAFDERQCLASALGDIVAVLLAGQLELRLGVNELPHLAVPEVLTGGQAATEVHQRRSLHQGVVDVEKGGRGQVGGRRGGHAGGRLLVLGVTHTAQPIQGMGH